MAGFGLAALELGLGQVIGQDGADLLWVLLLVGAGIGALDRTRWIAWVGGSALLILLVVQWIPGPATLGRRLIRADSLPPGGADAVIVLSASVTDQGLLNPVALDRLLEGTRLVRSGVARRLIVSRTETEVDDRIVDSEADQRALIRFVGVAAELSILTETGNTRGEAVRAKKLAEESRWGSIVVVTSPSHTKRACAVFEAVGFVVTCRPSPDRRIAWNELDSPRDRTRAFGEWLYETLGWLEYRARGWLSKPSRT
jgi:uncharacterized SAM-binding protein YcdF (DUF218 family)